MLDHILFKGLLNYCVIIFGLSPEPATPAPLPPVSKIDHFAFSLPPPLISHNYCSAWYKSKSKEHNFCLGPKKTKVTLENHHHQAPTKNISREAKSLNLSVDTELGLIKFELLKKNKPPSPEVDPDEKFWFKIVFYGKL